MAKLEAVVEFQYLNMETIRQIQEYFGMEKKVTVNYECPVRIDDDEKIEKLRETERRGYLRIKNTRIFSFPDTESNKK